MFKDVNGQYTNFSWSTSTHSTLIVQVHSSDVVMDTTFTHYICKVLEYITITVVEACLIV